MIRQHIIDVIPVAEGLGSVLRREVYASDLGIKTIQLRELDDGTYCTNFRYEFVGHENPFYSEGLVYEILENAVAEFNLWCSCEEIKKSFRSHPDDNNQFIKEEK